MNRIAFLSVLAVASLLSACASGPDIRSDYDHGADFARYRSFGFMSPLGTDKAGYRSLLTERLKTATRAQMEMRGYVYDEASPDLLVNFNARLQQKIKVVPAPPGPYYGYRAGFYGGWPGYGWGNEVYQYNEGTLNIDLVDARRRQLVWEGISTGIIDDLGAALAQSNVDNGVARIFSRYPFRAGSPAPQAPARGQ